MEYDAMIAAASMANDFSRQRSPVTCFIDPVNILINTISRTAEWLPGLLNEWFPKLNHNKS